MFIVVAYVIILSSFSIISENFRSLESGQHIAERTGVLAEKIAAIVAVLCTA